MFQTAMLIFMCSAKGSASSVLLDSSAAVLLAGVLAGSEEDSLPESFPQATRDALIRAARARESAFFCQDLMKNTSLKFCEQFICTGISGEKRVDQPLTPPSMMPLVKYF